MYVKSKVKRPIITTQANGLEMHCGAKEGVGMSALWTKAPPIELLYSISFGGFSPTMLSLEIGIKQLTIGGLNSSAWKRKNVLKNNTKDTTVLMLMFVTHLFKGSKVFLNWD